MVRKLDGHTVIFNTYLSNKVIGSILIRRLNKIINETFPRYQKSDWFNFKN